MKYDIIIIGGGISGLYIYYHLIKTNKKVILFEKNDYFGGRILNKSIHNINYPTGAARFNLNHKLVIKLLKEFNLLDFRKDNPISASMEFIDCKHKFSNHNLKNGFMLIKKVIKNAKKLKLNLKLYTFKVIAAMILTKKELDYMLVASGYSGQLKYMNASDAMHLFKYGIRDDILYYNGKYDLLIDKIVHYLKSNHANLKLNTEIKRIKYNEKDNLYQVNYNNKTIFGEKIVFSMPKPNLLKFNILSPIRPILKQSIHCKSLCRVYALFDKKDIWYQDIKDKLVINNALRYVIPLGRENPLIMISYTDDEYTQFWKSIQNSQTKLKKAIVDLIYSCLKITIASPLKVMVYHWNCGVGVWNKNIDSELVSNYLLNPLPNIYISGENYSLHQSWVEGALETSNKVLKIL